MYGIYAITDKCQFYISAILNGCGLFKDKNSIIFDTIFIISFQILLHKMSLSSSALNLGAPLSESTPNHRNGVTLLSYAKSAKSASSRRLFSTKSSVISSSAAAQPPPIVTKKSAEKFLRTLRKRSKSATRLRTARNSDNFDFRGSDTSLNRYNLDESSAEVNNKKTGIDVAGGEKVTLVGFTSNSEFAENTPKRAESGFLLRSADDSFLIDCLSTPKSNSGKQKKV